MSVLKGKEIYTWLSAPNKNHIWWVIGLVLVVLLVPILFRAFAVDGALIGEESYGNLNLAENPLALNEVGEFEDEPYFGERAWFSILAISPLFLSKWLPFLIGIISSVLFYLILRKLIPRYAFLASVFLIFSPANVYLFSVSSATVAGVFFSLLATWSYVNGRKAWATAALIVTGLFSVLCALLVWLVFLFYVVYVIKKDYKYLWWALFGIFISFILQFGYSLVVAGIPLIIFLKTFTLPHLIGDMFTDFGARFGFGLFSFLMALFGLFFVYKEKHRYLIGYIAIAISLMLSVYFEFILFYLNFLIVLFAAVGIIKLVEMEWKLDIVRSLVILFVICGLLFSFVSYMDRVVEFSPNEDAVAAMKFLQIEGGDSVILTNPDRASFVKYGGNVPLVSDKVVYYVSPKQRLDDINYFYTQNSFEIAEQIIKRHDVKFVWIDDEMKKEIAVGDNVNVVTLFSHSFARFFIAYSSPTVEIWEYLGA